MDPVERLTCEELLELPYFQDEGGVGWGRESDRPTRRHEKGARRRVPGAQYLPQLTSSTISPAPELKNKHKPKYDHHLPNI
ncbi:cyclin-dependent kinase-like 1 isoform X2 [Tachysurus ichikawai]